MRRQLLEGLDQKELIQQDYVRDILGGLLDKYAGEQVHSEDWDTAGLKNEVFTRFGVDIMAEGVKPDKLNRQELGDAIFAKLMERYDAKERLIGPDAMRHHERIIMLSVLDQLWKDHLLGMDHLKEGIGLRGYGQQDPLVEYKRESFDMFEAMMERFEEETVRFLYFMQVVDADEAERLRQQQRLRPEQAHGRCSRCARRQRRSRRKRRAQTSIDDMEEAFQRRKKRELEQARMAGSGDQGQVQQVMRSARKSGATILAPAAQAKSTRSAAELARKRQKSS